MGKEGVEEWSGDFDGDAIWKFRVEGGGGGIGGGPQK